MKAEDESGKKNKEEETMSGEFDNSELESALRDFRASVHAWSDAAYHRPRALQASAAHGIAWRRAAAWVLSLAISAGMLTFGLYERHQHQVQAALAHQREVEQQQEQARQRAREAEEQLAKIDNELARVDMDVSREVPRAMEPLAQLVEYDGK